MPKRVQPVLLRARIKRVSCLEKKRLRDRERTITEERVPKRSGRKRYS